MRHRRTDVIDRAIVVLDEQGLDEWSMRRLAADLGVQPSALYHHFSGKDELMAAVADELLRRGRRPAEIVTWESELRLVSVELRDAMRSHRDAAELIAAVHTRGVGAQEPLRRMAGALQRAGADDELARVGASTLLHFVFAHVSDDDRDFALGLDIVLDGLTARLVR
ncbi:TetR family transcriptional regulator [Nocardioides humilatus]|uniref:TetR family transcriptional regulator n=1 Tax=Nocardioides humilatus TaxID=2607660 RepID=A0A5B1LGV4_9ACTN|nr:TetR family transcriptional regulator [Nocardioides humilatus]